MFFLLHEHQLYEPGLHVPSASHSPDLGCPSTMEHVEHMNTMEHRNICSPTQRTSSQLPLPKKSISLVLLIQLPHSYLLSHLFLYLTAYSIFLCFPFLWIG